MDMRTGNSADAFLLILFRALAALSLFAVLWMHIAAPARASAIFLIAAATLTAVIALAARRTPSVPAVSGQEFIGGTRPTDSTRSGAMLATIVLLGCALRLIVWLNYPVELVSDHKTYWELARRLVAEGRYEAEEGRAFWPPGLPFVLTPFVLVFGSGALLAFNITGYLALVAAIWGLARQLFDQRVALMAATIVTCWPNLIFLASLATKEVVVAAAIPALILCYIRAHGVVAGLVPYAAGAGALAGLISLVQPSSLLVSVVIAVIEAWRTSETRRWWSGMLRLTVFAIAMAAVIAPWTVRNYAVLGTFVPIGTAGGVNFATVNSGASDGRWNPAGHQAAFALSDDEVERSRRGFEAGWRFILENPGRFMVMAVRKPLYMFGDDTKNIYWATGRDSTIGSLHLAVLKNASLVYYFAILLAATWWAWSRTPTAQGTVGARLVMLLCLFPIPAHLFFEASERHRAGTVACFSILAAAGIRAAAPMIGAWIRGPRYATPGT